MAKSSKYAEGLLDDLLVVMPMGELGYSRFHMMLQTIPDYGYLLMTGRVISQMGSYPHQAAQDLVQAALKVKGWRRLLFLEHDHEFPPDVFRRHAAQIHPIVSGLYTLRDVEEPLPVIYMWDEGRHNAVLPDAGRVNEIIANPGLHKMDCVPLGCTSIDRKVLEGWSKDHPFFSSFTNPRGATISHDIFFCRLAQDSGFQAYVDSRIQVKHLVQVPLDVPYFVRWWNAVGAPRAAALREAEEVL